VVEGRSLEEGASSPKGEGRRGVEEDFLLLGKEEEVLPMVEGREWW